MFNILKTKLKISESPKFTRSCIIYIDTKSDNVIVISQNGITLLLEDPRYVYSASINHPQLLGEIVCKALSNSSEMPSKEIAKIGINGEYDLRDTKIKDWPAFKSSGIKTAKEFSKRYVRFSVAQDKGIWSEFFDNYHNTFSLSMSSYYNLDAPGLHEKYGLEIQTLHKNFVSIREFLNTK